MKQTYFIRIDMDDVPTTIAELFDLNDGFCQMGRMIEMADRHSISGGMSGDTRCNLLNIPCAVVPHPSTYDDFTDITTRHLSQQEFEQLWEETLLKFPELAN